MSTEKKYTPGPWKMSLPKRPTCPYQVATDRQIIADCWSPSPAPEDQPEVRANATLIAAAPDMYEALTSLVKIFDSEKQSIYAFASTELEKAKQALSKATNL